MASVRRHCFGLVFAFNACCLIILATLYHKGGVFYRPKFSKDEEDGESKQRPTTASIPLCTTSVRASSVDATCRRLGYATEPINWARVKRNLIVDDDHKLVYCSIPKCGSKTFKHYLGKLSNPDFVVGWSVDMNLYYNVTRLRSFRDVDDDEKKRVLRDYVKFMVVRHPLDRLRSAWLHKMSEAGSSHILRSKESLVTDHLKAGDPSSNATFNYRNDSLPFERFLELIVTKTDEGFRNAHWVSYYEHCQPCHVRYDHVLRLETLPGDIGAIYRHLRALNSSGSIEQITHDNKVRPEGGMEKLEEIKHIYEVIDNTTIEGLLDVYERDFNLYGYRWSRKDGATCHVESQQCC